MKTTSAPHDLYTSVISFMVSGRPPSEGKSASQTKKKHEIFRTLLFRFPECHTFWTEIIVYKPQDRWAKYLFLVGTNPDQIPITTMY
jgi:hypothetical protein